MWADDAFESLGIPPTQDVRAIKRAYAARLKHTRPEDDAEAWQALRENFDRALAWAERVVLSIPAGTEADSADAAADHATPAQAEERAAPVVAERSQRAADLPPAADPPPLAREPVAQPSGVPALAQASPAAHIDPAAQGAADLSSLLALIDSHADPAVVDDWLAEHLLGFEARRRAAPKVLVHLDAAVRLPSTPIMDVLRAHFDWQGHSPRHHERRVLARLDAAVELARSITRTDLFDDDQRRQRDMDVLLCARPGLLRRLWFALWPIRTRRLVERIDELDLLAAGQIDRVIGPDQVVFWRRFAAGDGWPMRALWAGVWLVRALLLTALFCLPSLLQEGQRRSGARVDWEYMAWLGLLGSWAAQAAVAPLWWRAQRQPAALRTLRRGGLWLWWPLLVFALVAWGLSPWWSPATA